MSTVTFQQYSDSKNQIEGRVADLRDHVIVSLWEQAEKMMEHDIELRRQLDEARQVNTRLQAALEVESTRNNASVDMTGGALNKFMLPGKV